MYEVKNLQKYDTYFVSRGKFTKEFSAEGKTGGALNIWFFWTHQPPPGGSHHPPADGALSSVPESSNFVLIT